MLEDAASPALHLGVICDTTEISCIVKVLGVKTASSIYHEDLFGVVSVDAASSRGV